MYLEKLSINYVRLDKENYSEGIAIVRKWFIRLPFYKVELDYHVMRILPLKVDYSLDS